MADSRTSKPQTESQSIPAPAEPVPEPQKELTYQQATSKLAGLGVNWSGLVSKILNALVQEIEEVLGQAEAARQQKR